jgi:transcriptional regulator with XRE-family HTH domain
MSRSGEKCLGDICTYFRDIHTPSPGEVRMLDLYAEFAASAIEHHQQIIRLEHRQALAVQLARELVRLVDEGGAPSASHELASLARALASEISGPLEAGEAESMPSKDELDERLFGLSASEVQMLVDIGQGFSEAQIAARMGISRFTLAKQLAATVRRIEAETPLEAGDLIVREMFSPTAGNRPSFSQLLRHLRLGAGLTQTELGERAGLSHRTISDLERGTRRKTYSSTVRLLARALELSPEETARLDDSVDRTRGKPTRHRHLK